MREPTHSYSGPLRVAFKGSEHTAMFAGRCRVEGDVILAARLEAMFGGS
jgi:hypothetical protein